METAEPVAAHHGLSPQIVNDFGELIVGDWEGHSFEELGKREDWRMFNACRSSARAPGGELIIETQMRMVRQIEALRHRHEREMVVVISHGDPLRSLIAYHLGIPLDFLLRFEINPASVSVLETADSGSRVLCVNAIGELPL
jgi:probable phosphoglycerate mutase